MRIRRIEIGQWRHFENISIEVPEDAGLVCIVGANGTGKSHLLELIGACAHRFGLSQGVDIPRGDPFADPHKFNLTFYLAPGVSDAMDQGIQAIADHENWDRTLTIISKRVQNSGAETFTLAGGIPNPRNQQFAQQVFNLLHSSKEVHFLSLDADRAYPKKNVHVSELAQAYETDWENLEYTKGRSFKPSSTLYDEWSKYFLASENQSGTKLVKEIRQARLAEQSDPSFEDHFEPYKAALQSVLPHVTFMGVDSKKRDILFDTTGLELSFNQLSGGEREIAFLVGQIDRFGLRQGVFILDEPELHLNADLIRSWVGYLTGTVEEGQIWLATHSLEAVEAAGQEATFVLERNEETRKVDRLDRLDNRPVLSALSRSVGTPAFSLSRLRFVFVEGEESLGERERFRSLTGITENTRYMECGSCNEVSRRILAVRSLAEAAAEPLRVGGVVDRDFRLDAEADALAKEADLHVLGVHEIENLHLHPETVDVILQQNGITDVSASELIQEGADQRAGAWIFQRALSYDSAQNLPDFLPAQKETFKALPWTTFEEDISKINADLRAKLGWDDDDFARLEKLLGIAVKAYAKLRESNDLWKFCEGKQVLSSIYTSAGSSGPKAFMQVVHTAWERDAAPVSEPLQALRDYIAAL